MQSFRFGSLTASLLIAIVLAGTADAQFQSAVITLSFPPGARATGLGEAFTGLADDANATYYNPAGLGQAPLANAWKSYLTDAPNGYYAVATKRQREFSLREKIWVGTPQGLMRYNGKAWEDFETYLIEEGDQDLYDIASGYLRTDNEEVLAEAVQMIRMKNDIEMDRYSLLRDLLKSSVPPEDSTTSTSPDLAAAILDIDPGDRDSLEIYSVLAAHIDSSKAAPLAGEAATIVKTTTDREFDRLVDVKIPFSIAVQDSITALMVDATDGLWIGTPNGLWRFDGPSWVKYTILDGLPSDFVTSLAEGPGGEVAVGTDHGFAVYSEARWRTYDLEDSGLKSKYINAMAIDEKATFLATHEGLLRKEGNTWTLFDTTSGLVSQEVTALMIDNQDRLWVGGHNGLALKDQATWKRYKFPESVVHSIADYQEGRVWIGTDKGAITYTEGESSLDENGELVQEPPEWKAFHSKNALVGNEVFDIAVHGNDIWLVTDKGVNRYDYAEKELLFFWELLLPALKIRDLYHSYFSFVYPTEDWGTLALLVNFLYFGENDLTDEEGRITEQFTSWELVAGLSYGLELKQDLSLGLSIKYVRSQLVPALGSDGIGQSFAIDAALLKRNFLTPGFDVGLNLQNMGKPIFYGNPDNPDPLPFTVRLGMAYTAFENPVHDLTLLLDISRELAGKEYGEKLTGFWDAIYYDLKMDKHLKEDTTLTESERRWMKFKDEFSQIQLNAGLEWWYVNFLALRTGFLFDYIGERYELTFGLGIKYGTLAFDFSLIHSPEGFMSGFFKRVIDDPEDTHREGSHGVRHGQPRFSLIFRF